MKYGILSILFTLFLTLFLRAETQINNDISGNVQWFKSNSPYIINRSIKIAYGSTLSIESGAEILLKSDVKIIAEGTINVAGDPANYVIFNAYNNAKWDYLEIKNKAVISYLELRNGGSLNQSPLMINGNNDIVINNINLIDNTSNTVNFNPEGASNIYLKDLGYDYLINKNHVINEFNTVWIDKNVNISIAKDIILRIKGKFYANGIADEPIVIKGYNGKWGGLYFDEGSDGKFTFTEFAGGGTSTLTQTSMILTNGGDLNFNVCRFDNSQSSAITILKSTVFNLSDIGYNSFINYKKPYYAIVNLSTTNIDANNNCFGTADSSFIDNMIYDGKDRTGKGLIEYLPLSESCELQIPEKTVLLSPIDNSIDNPINLNLKWKNNIFANKYLIEIYDDSNLFEPIESATIQDTVISIFNLDYGASYYWKVTAVNSKGVGVYSDLFSFVTYDTSRPKPPNIIFPKNNDLLDCGDYIQWNNVKNADVYYLEVSEDIDFNRIIFTDSTFKYDTLKYVDLELDHNYYLRIRAKNRNGFGEWSNPIGFRTKKLLNFDYSLEFGRNIIDVKILDDSSINYSMLTKDNSFYYIDLIDLDNAISNIYKNEKVINDFIAYDINNDNTLEYVVFHNDYFNILGNKVINHNISAFNPQILDFNNDTKIDLIYTDSTSSTLSIIYDILKETPQIDLTFDISNYYYIYDIDRNSFYDILTFSDNNLICLLNDGNNFTEITLKENMTNGKIYVANNDNSTNINIIIINEKTEIFEINNELKIINNHTLSYVANNLVFCNISDSNHNNIIFINDSLISIYDDFLTNRLIYQGNINYNNFTFNPILNEFLIAWNTNQLDFYTINNCSKDNPPNAADNLRFTYSNNDIILEWSHSIDDNTQTKSMKYILEIVDDNTYEYVLNSNKSGKILITNNYFQLKNIQPGKYKWSVTAFDNAGNQLKSDYGIFRTKNFSSGPPESWYFEKKTGNNSLLILRSDVQPKFNDRLLVAGDAVGVFYFRDSSLVCGGYGIWQDNQNMPITAWGDNFQTENIKDGFEFAEDFRFKFWDSFLENEYDISFNIQSGLLFFKPDTVTILGSIVEPDTQNIILYPNTVNLISSAIIPYNTTASNLFNNQYVSNILNGKSSQEVKFWKSNSGYEIYSDVLDTITFSGTLINTNNFSVSLNNNHWHLIPNPLKYDILIDSLFSDKNVILINDLGQIYWKNEGLNEFNILHSNRAVYCFSFDNYTLFYNTLEYAANENQFNIPNFTSNYQLLIFNFDTILNGIVKIKDKQNYVIAEKNINNDKIIFLINGFDSLAQFDGIKSNEELFAFYENNEIEIPIIYNEIIDLRDSSKIVNLIFNSKSISQIHANINNTSVQLTNANNVKIYPNPVNHTLFFENFDDNKITAYDLYDFRGRLIVHKECNCNFSEIDVKKYSPGSYILKLNYFNKTIDVNILIIK